MRNGPPANRVLVVDDDPAVRETFRRILQDAGYAVLAVNGGQEALDVLKDDRSIGLILLDWDMPGVNGADVRRTQLADERLRGIPTVIVSGSGRVRGEDLGNTAYLQKPCGRAELLAVVSQHCHPVRQEPSAAPE
jgi:CheY-like chemotaxis protein